MSVCAGHLGKERRRAVNGSPPGGVLDQVVAEEARQTSQAQANSEGLLGAFGREPCENGLQLPTPEDLPPHPVGSMESEWAIVEAAAQTCGSKVAGD